MGVLSEHLETINNRFQNLSGQGYMIFHLSRKDIFHTHTRKTQQISKESSSASSFHTSEVSGSLTIEAALVLPIFLFFVMNIIFTFCMLDTENRVYAALHQTGNRMCFSGYSTNAIGESARGMGASVLSVAYATMAVKNEVGEAYLERSPVVNGGRGISLLGSQIMDGEDVIVLKAGYLIKPFFRGTGFPGFRMQNIYYGRAWTGYVPAGYEGGVDGRDPVVYVTQHATVYHTDQNCRYLNPSIHVIDVAQLETARNGSGGRYYACEICGAGPVGVVVYITDQGDRYHNSLLCAGLRRTVYTMRLSEVGGMRKCIRCP